MKRGLTPLVVLLASTICLTSCRTVRVVEQVPVDVHDTTYVTKTLHDSTYIDRWHTIYQQSDTVYIRDSISVIKYSLIADTAFRYVEKPVTITRTERVEVKKPLSWWVKTQLWGFWILLVSALGYAAWKTRNVWLKYIIKL